MEKMNIGRVYQRENNTVLEEESCKINNDLNGKLNIFFHNKIKSLLGIRKYVQNFQDVLFCAMDKNIFGIICRDKNEINIIYEKFGFTINKLVHDIWKTANIKQKYYCHVENNLIEVPVDANFNEKSKSEVIDFNEKKQKQNFKNFVISKENGATIEICKSIACANKKDLIPAGSVVFLYGECCSGKTHLLNAIKQNYSELGGSVLYITASNFLKQYVQSVKQQNTCIFQESIINNDIILIDNVDSLVGKNGTLLALQQLLNMAVEQQKYIVLTSSVNSQILNDNSRILKTIISNAIQISVKEPTNDIKERILINHIIDNNICLPITIVKELVRKMDCNIRELKNCLKKLEIIQSVNKIEINTALALEILAEDNEIKKDDLLTNEKIISRVADYYYVKQNDILSNIRTKNVCKARNVVIFLMHKINSVNFQEIGRLLNRNHSTIISGLKNIEFLLKNDKKFPAELAEIKSLLK